jgi:hypothetical protein
MLNISRLRFPTTGRTNFVKPADVGLRINERLNLTDFLDVIRRRKYVPMKSSTPRTSIAG